MSLLKKCFNNVQGIVQFVQELVRLIHCGEFAPIETQHHDMFIARDLSYTSDNHYSFEAFSSVTTPISVTLTHNFSYILIIHKQCL